MSMSKKDYGPLTDAISAMPEKYKPKVHVHAQVGGYGVGGDSGYHKQEAKRLKKEIAAINNEISGFDHKVAGEKVLRALRQEKAAKTGRLMECEAMMDDGEDEGGGKGKKAAPSEEDEEEEEGSVVGGPYEVVSEGGKWKVKNMEKGTTKGTFGSRGAALKQFRLLEGIEHGWSPSR